MDVIAIGAQVIYFMCVVGLAIYGLHTLWLSLLTLYHPAEPRPTPKRRTVGQWPRVTIQLPMYNEQHVAERLILACAALDYPSHRLQIQVLDDSDDTTTALVTALATRLQAQGVSIEVIRRPDRRGYKAGALAYAMGTATGEFIAIFDADFVPPPDYLRRIIPYFQNSRNETAPHAPVGFVQARWGHLNRGFSWLTHSQALALDGHFLVEQLARANSGFAFGFNGSAGVWRRACIEDPHVGGWQDDTLCEDLDLSYRAQMAGWRGVFVPHGEVPAEIPVQILALKRQQFRWAKGTIQTLRKIGAPVARQQDWTPVKRIAAFAHLTGYLIHPLLVLMLLITLPMLLWNIDPSAQLAYLSIFSFGPPLLYALGQIRRDRHGWWRRFAWLPLLMLLGTGLALNNTQAVIEGWRQRGGAFLRTPKFQIQESRARWQHSAYSLPLHPMILGEAFLTLYALAACIVAAISQQYGSIPFLLIYAAGFGLMVGVELWQAWQTRRRGCPPLPATDPQRLATRSDQA
jgi:cellulose synthase/poly-beta-1,6-N-acetylglucosamine synthase-like glycosyltransferase